MSSQTIPVTLIGAGGCGGQMLQALTRSSAVKLVGLADKDPAVAARAGQSAGVPQYADNRRLLAETRPQIAFVCAPPMEFPEILALCADRNIHVWRETPLARNLGEGIAHIRRMEQAGLKLAVGTQRRFAPGYVRARELRDKVGKVFLARAHYLFNWGPYLAWRGDRASAGGGALMDLGYHPIDLLIWMLGLPEEVYGSTAGGKDIGPQVGPDGKLLPAYDTDDTATALLRYRGHCVASVVTTRCSGPVSEGLLLHGQCGSLSASDESCLLRDPDGSVLDRIEDTAPLDVYVRQVEAFARAVADGAKTYECSARENLLTLATIEAIYLSDRTSQPEHPLRLLKTNGLGLSDCLIHRPAEMPAPSAHAPVEPPCTDEGAKK